LQYLHLAENLQLLTGSSKLKILALLPLLALCFITIPPASAYSIMQFRPMTSPNVNMIAKNVPVPVPQPFNQALRTAQAVPKVFYSKWGFGIIDLSNSPIGSGNMPDCQVT